MADMETFVGHDVEFQNRDGEVLARVWVDDDGHLHVTCYCPRCEAERELGPPEIDPASLQVKVCEEVAYPHRGAECARRDTDG